MCTLTWRIGPHDYELHFNRDESRKRPIALPPKIHQHSDARFIAPIDPQAGGTWISTNEYGISLCLLNHYAASLAYQGDTSRGQLLLQLATCKSLREFRNKLSAINLPDFSPFDLLSFQIGKPVLHTRWDGLNINTAETNTGFISSSGWNTDNVIAARQRLFDQLGDQSLSAFHRSHLPDRSAYSVCMHREDARTQSYSKILVDEVSNHFIYTDGPPCQNLPTHQVSVENPIGTKATA